MQNSKDYTIKLKLSKKDIAKYEFTPQTILNMVKEFLTDKFSIDETHTDSVIKPDIVSLDKSTCTEDYLNLYVQVIEEDIMYLWGMSMMRTIVDILYDQFDDFFEKGSEKIIRHRITKPKPAVNTEDILLGLTDYKNKNKNNKTEQESNGMNKKIKNRR